MEPFKITLKLNAEASPHLYVRQIKELISDDNYLHPMLKGLLLTLKKARMPYARLSLEKEIVIVPGKHLHYERATSPDIHAWGKIEWTEEEKEEFILMIPFTPQGKNNMAAWMAARSDGENYGQLLVYKFPKQKLVFGPAQVISRINQNPDISRQISLWDQRGSEVNLGPLLVIPIGKSLIYVRPLYIRAEGGSIPELKRVIVAYENRIAMRKTLNEALEVIFEGGVEVSTEELEESFSGNITEEANRIFQEAVEAQRQGDWSLYGEKIKDWAKF